MANLSTPILRILNSCSWERKGVACTAGSSLGGHVASQITEAKTGDETGQRDHRQRGCGSATAPERHSEGPRLLSCRGVGRWKSLEKGGRVSAKRTHHHGFLETMDTRSILDQVGPVTVRRRTRDPGSLDVSAASSVGAHTRQWIVQEEHGTRSLEWTGKRRTLSDK